jgi:hypothetical protein
VVSTNAITEVDVEVVDVAAVDELLDTFHAIRPTVYRNQKYILCLPPLTTLVNNRPPRMGAKRKSLMDFAKAVAVFLNFGFGTHIASRRLELGEKGKQ